MQRIKKVLENEAKAILEIPLTNDFYKACEIIYETVHRQKGKVIVSGVGKSGQIASIIASSLSSTGTPSVFLHASDAQHGDLGVIQPNDVLLLISNSGETVEIFKLCKLAKKMSKRIKIVLITGNHDSKLGQIADVVLLNGNPKEVCPFGLTPTTSSTTSKVIGDVLVLLMMEKIEFTSEDYVKRHHGGQLGKKLRKYSC